MSRTIARAVARRQYDRFSRDWRREKRMAGHWGRPGRKPTFSEWYHLHQGDSGMMDQSTPADIREYLGMDPWQPDPRAERMREQVEAARRAIDEATGGERGVTTIPIIGEDE